MSVSCTPTNSLVDLTTEDEGERYNTDLAWLTARPPAGKGLHGKLFLGWYQPIDLTSYLLPQSLLYNNLVDMKAVIDNIPQFIVSYRQLLAKREGNASPTITNAPTIKDREPHIRNEHEQYNDTDSRLLTDTDNNSDLNKGNYPKKLYLMMEYLVEISVPSHLLSHFSLFKDKVQGTSPRSRPQSAARRTKPPRWVFTPCHCSPDRCFADISETLDNYIHVLVVGYDNYRDYVSVCGGSHVIARLPDSPYQTTGYFHYWIQKLAVKLCLHQIWVVDDQVKSFYRTVPGERLPLKKHGTRWQYDVEAISERLASYSEVMTHLEKVMLEDISVNSDSPLTLIGLSNEICAMEEPYHYNIPSGAVLMNLSQVRDITFHPELHQLHFQVFACEAVKAGKRVFVCNSFVLLDASWNTNI